MVTSVTGSSLMPNTALISSAVASSPTGDELGDAILLVLREAEDAGHPQWAGDVALELVAEVAASDPVDDLAEDPVGRRRVVLVARAGLPVEAPFGEPLHATLPRVHHCGAPSGAWGKPAVCSITCSTVITSLPFVPNSGM